MKPIIRMIGNYIKNIPKRKNTLFQKVKPPLSKEETGISGNIWKDCIGKLFASLRKTICPMELLKTIYNIEMQLKQQPTFCITTNFNSICF